MDSDFQLGSAWRDGTPPPYLYRMHQKYSLRRRYPKTEGEPVCAPNRHREAAAAAETVIRPKTIAELVAGLSDSAVLFDDDLAADMSEPPATSTTCPAGRRCPPRLRSGSQRAPRSEPPGPSHPRAISPDTLAALESEEEIGMVITAIHRSDGWIFVPAGETELQADGVLIVRGTEEGLTGFESGGGCETPPELK
ncbi:TrkA C-terminal domain-containing protein (plasmid) [Haloferacaceae archaeon DSL9]